MGDRSLVEFCGHCKRQQPYTGDPQKCKDCGRSTVTWNIDKESASDAERKWRQLNSD